MLLQPVVAAGIFSVVFGRVAGLDSGGVPYFLFSYTGMLAWNLFAGVITRAAPSLVSNQALVSKVFFPRMLVPLATTLSVLLDFVVALGLGAVLLVVYDVTPGWAVLLLPAWVVLMVLLGAGIGLAASAVMVKYRDVAYIVPWLVQVLLFAAPVAYALDSVPANLQPLYSLNPLTWLLEEFRWSLLGTPAPEPWQIGASVVVCVGVFVAGALVFQQLEREFADVI